MRVFVTGGSSYLGRTLVPLAVSRFETGYSFFSRNRLDVAGGVRLDVRDATAVSRTLAAFAPDVIIHTVGSNRCDDMTAVIVEGTANVTAAARQLHARLIHLSTDSIFDGKSPPYDENAQPTPVNEYGRAKAQAEQIVKTHPNHVIIRTSLIYGFNEMDHGTQWMAAALQKGQPVTLFNNQFRNPVWVETLALACLELAENEYRGVLNVAGRQRLSRAEFGLRMLDWWQVEPRHTLTISPSSEGRWPLDCTLDLTLGTAVLQTPLLGLDELYSRQKNPGN